MHDNKYDRINTIASKEAARDEIAAAMAAYERQHGPIQTAPIISRGPQIRYNNRSVDAERAQARARSQAKQRKRPVDAQAKPTQHQPANARCGTRQGRARAVLREEWP